MTAISSFLNSLELVAKQAAETENDFRREFPNAPNRLNANARSPIAA